MAGGQLPAATQCLRPEQLAIEPAPAGPSKVVATRFKGSVAEVELHHGADGAARTFFHRPSAARLTPGLSVVLRVLALVCLVLSGCGRSGSVPELVPREIRSWPLNPDGPSLPTPRSVSIGNDDELAVLDTAGRVSIYNPAGERLRQWQMLDVSVGKPEGPSCSRTGGSWSATPIIIGSSISTAKAIGCATSGRHGREPGQFEYPVGICKDAAENLYICEYGGNDRIQKFTREGEFVTAFGSFGTAPGQFQRPSGLAWHDGKLYVADSINNRVLVFSDAGQYQGLLGGPERPLTFKIPYDVTFAPDGNLYVIEYGAGRLSKISLRGELLGQMGQTGSGSGQFATPWGITVDSQSRIHIATRRTGVS